MYAALRLEALLFLMALAYLTRLPVPRDLPDSDDLQVRSIKYHTAVGMLIGLCGAAMLWSAAAVLPWGVAVVLSLAITLLLTGAFHEHGLAEASEGLSAGRNRAEVLRIMDGAGFGFYGAVTLGMVLALKLALLFSFSGPVAGMALIAGHAAGRMAAVHVTATTYYARSEGMQRFIPAVTRDGYRVALALTCLALAGLVVVSGTTAAICGFAGSVLLAQAFRRIVINRIGGYTGACLGGSQQMGELGLYLGLAIWL
ncbi:adenosylcobinamide-GDP ribazoletransferase [Antarctobacter jejuensis]|uniref:adenosylcobinamide-GDP ribazoletransferase n=1 Tax=Antarctobacter jejuensis TaxID=1439938 RepID=UPI003FD21C26